MRTNRKTLQKLISIVVSIMMIFTLVDVHVFATSSSSGETSEQASGTQSSSTVQDESSSSQDQELTTSSESSQSSNGESETDSSTISSTTTLEITSSSDGTTGKSSSLDEESSSSTSSSSSDSSSAETIPAIQPLNNVIISPNVNIRYSIMGSSGGISSGENTTIISKSDVLQLRLEMTPQFNTGEITDPGFVIELPYFYYNDSGELVSTINYEEVPEAYRGDNAMGIRASVSNIGEFAILSTPDDQNYYKGEMELRYFDGRLSAGGSVSVELAYSFYGNVPENAIAIIRAGGRYRSYIDATGEYESNYVIQPGESDGSVWTAVNSNLIWDVDIDQLSAPVLWEKYNYIAYRIEIQNNSMDEAAKFDNVLFSVTPQSADVLDSGIEDQDMMKWIVDEEGKLALNPTPNDFSEDLFGGVVKDGGVLIYDMTDIPEEELVDLDVINFSNFEENGHPLHNYNYTQNRDVTITTQNRDVTKGESLVYYVAVPMRPNLLAAYNNQLPVNFVTSIAFSENVSWAKEASSIFNFSQVIPDFKNTIVVKNEADVDVKEDTFEYDELRSYYVNYLNSTNVPAFHAYSTITLEEGYDLQKIRLHLYHLEGEDVSLSREFESVSDQIIQVSMSDGDTESFVSLGAPTLAQALDTNDIYELDVATQIEAYLAANPGVEFTGKIQIHYRERIDSGVELDGLVEIIGIPNPAFDNIATVVTDYQTWMFVPQFEDDIPANYHHQDHQTTQDTVILKIKKAIPLLETEAYAITEGTANYLESLSVSLNQAEVGFRYRIGNDSTFPIVSGRLNSGSLVGDSYSLNAEKITISSELIAKSEIGTLILYGPKKADNTVPSVQINFDTLEINLEGEAVIGKSAWQSLGELEHFEIVFSHVNGSLALSENAAIHVEGTVDETGRIIPMAELSSTYVQSEYNMSVKDSAQIGVDEINVIITAQSHYLDQSSSINTSTNSTGVLEVPHDVLARYQFDISNQSTARVTESEIIFDLSSSVKELLAGSDILDGFEPTQISLSDNLNLVGSIKEIQFYNWDDELTDGTPSLTLTLDELGYKTSEELIISSSAWSGDVTNLKAINLVFDSIYSQDVSSASTIEHLQVIISGYSNAYDELDGEARFTPYEEKIMEKATSATARLEVVRPGLIPYTTVHYEQLDGITAVFNSSADKNKDTLGIPYDRDFNYTIKFDNPYISTLDYLDTTITFALNDESKAEEAHTGFHVTKVEVSTEVLNQLNDDVKISFVDVDDPTNVADFNYDKTTQLLTYGESPKQEVELIGDEFVIDLEMIKALGVTHIGSMLIHSKNSDFRNTEANDVWIDVHGYLDADFDVVNPIVVTTDNYISGVIDDAFKVSNQDQSDAIVSRMYFDTVLVAGYNDVTDDEGQLRFDKLATPFEEVRNYYRTSGHGQFYDNSELEIGYKGIGSYMLDFRQYPNVGTNYPEGATDQSHRTLNYIFTQSLNTAVDIEMTLDIPETHFDAYYIKIDPSVIDYIEMIEVEATTGNFTITKEQIETYAANGVEVDENGQRFFRVNLLASEAERFSDVAGTDYSTIYESQKTIYAAQSHVTGLVFTMSANQTQSTAGIANNPDLGYDYVPSDQSTRFMIEVTGRFTKTGNAIATATTKLVTSSDRALVRESSGSEKSDWSYRDYYTFYTSYYSSSKRTEEYTSAHLISQANVIVTPAKNLVKVGTATNINASEKLDATIGEYIQYPISFSRTDSTNVDYSAGTKGTFYRQDPNDWVGKISYIDYVNMTMTFPSIRKDEDSYYGFLVRDIELKPSMMENIESITVYGKTVVDDPAVSNTGGMGGYTSTKIEEPLLELSGAKINDYLISDGEKAGSFYLAVLYAESGESLADSGGRPAILMEDAIYPHSVEIRLKDLSGHGDYAREYKENPNLVPYMGHGTSNDIDAYVGGEPYTIAGINPKADATLTMTHNIESDQGEVLTENPAVSAVIQGYRIPFQIGYSITESASHYYDYYDVSNGEIIGNITPTLARFDLAVWNRTDGSTPELQSTRIEAFDLTQRMNHDESAFNLQRIFIPTEFIEGDWFNVNAFTLEIAGSSITYDKATFSSDTYLIKDSEQYYYIDVEAILRDEIARLHKFSVNNSAEQYVSEFVSNLTISIDAVTPTSDPTTTLDGGQYLTSDKTSTGHGLYLEGVFVNRSQEDFTEDKYNENSRPTFGYNTNNFEAIHDYVRMSVVADPYDVNAQSYGGHLSGTDEHASFAISNRVAQMIVDITRGINLDDDQATLESFAYDVKWNEVSKNMEIISVNKEDVTLYDFIDHHVTFGAGEGTRIPLQESTLRFSVPEGMRIIGWTLESDTFASDPILSATASASVGGTSIALLNELFRAQTSFELAPETFSYFDVKSEDEATLTHIQQLVIDIENNEIQPGEKVELIVHTQIIDDSLAVENRNLSLVYEAHSQPNHTYPQYQIIGNGNNSDYVSASQPYTYKDAGAEAYATSNDINYYRYHGVFDAGFTPGYTVSNYISRINSRVTTRLEDELSLEFVFSDLTSQYDQQASQIKVRGYDVYGKKVMDVVNDGGHDLSHMTMEVSFINETTLEQDFNLTEFIHVDAPVNMIETQEILIEYMINGEWVKEVDVVSVSEASAVRWTYYDVPRVGTDGNLVVLIDDENPILLTGVSSYHDLRSDEQKLTTPAADTYTANLRATKTYAHEHDHVYTDTVPNPELITSSVNYQGEGAITKLVRRERPILELHTQIFADVSEAAIPYGADDMPSQTLGYRPGDEVVFKTSIQNIKVETETNTLPQGVWLDPVIYDKLPVYVDAAILNDTSVLVMKWYDIDGNEKVVPPFEIETYAIENVADYGGDVTINKAVSATHNTNGKHYADMDIDDPLTSENEGNSTSNPIDYTMVKITFEPGTRVEVGERIEFYYEVEIDHTNAGLPLVYTQIEESGVVYPEYYPKMGEYHSTINSTYYNRSYPFMIQSDVIANENIMMDLNYLIHDVGVSGSLNKSVDRWEYLEGSSTYLPGTTANDIHNGYYTDIMQGNNTVLIDYDSASANNMQKVVYEAQMVASNTTVMPAVQSYLGLNNAQRSIYTQLYKYRTELKYTDWDKLSDGHLERNPIIWTSARVHLQTAWISASSEMIPDAQDGEVVGDVDYDLHALRYLAIPDLGVYNPNYVTTYLNGSYGSWYHNRNVDLGDDHITTMEYQENYTAQISAYNYGDWGVDGIEFIYVYPYGASPQMDADGNLDIEARYLSAGNTVTPTYSSIDAANVSYSIIQTPENDQGYRAANDMQDPLLSQDYMNKTGSQNDTAYYDDTVVPYAIKVIVQHPLNKWFNRGDETGYVMQVDIASTINANAASGYWYDQVYAQPIETASGNHLYSQIHGISVYQGDIAKTLETYPVSIEKYGMDYLYRPVEGANTPSYNGSLYYQTGSMNMPYIDGYNIQNNEVILSFDANRKTSERLAQESAATISETRDLYRNDEVDAYAKTGTQAQMREPLIRVWNTVGQPTIENVYGSNIEDYYMLTGFDNHTMNIHVENRYYWNDQSLNRGDINNSGLFEKAYHNYATDGGNEGTLFMPVVTNLLPFGVTPLDISGVRFSEDNDLNATMQLDWSLNNGAGEDINVPVLINVYEAKVQYITVENEIGEQEGRYLVTFSPIEEKQDEAKILSSESVVFSFEFITLETPDSHDKDGNVHIDLTAMYQENISIVTSQLDGFRYTTDNHIANNPFAVGSPWNAYIPYTYYTTSYSREDNRKDAMVAKDGYNSNFSGGVIPSSVVDIQDKDYLLLSSMSDGVLDVGAGDTIELETFTKDQFMESEFVGRYSQVVAFNDLVEQEDGVQGVMNGIHLRVALPLIYNEVKVSNQDSFEGERSIAINTSEEIKKNPDKAVYALADEVQYYPNVDFGEEEFNRYDAVEFGDYLWYTSSVYNHDPQRRDDFSGDIMHAKMLISIELPSIVRYEDEFEIQLSEFNAGTSSWNVVQKATSEELENPTVEEDPTAPYVGQWEVKLLYDEVDAETNQQTLVFEVLTPSQIDPSLSAQEQYDLYSEGLNFAGYLASDQQVSIKLKTRVNPLEEPTLSDDIRYWDEGYVARSYVTFEESDGAYLNVENIGQQEIGSKIFIRTTQDDFTEPSALVDYDHDGVEDRWYAEDMSAQVVLLKPSATVRLDTALSRLEFEHSGSSEPLTADLSMKSSDISRVYLDQITSDSALSELIVDYRLPQYSTINETTQAPTNQDLPVDNTIVTIRTGIWELPSYLDTAMKDILMDNLRVYVYALKPGLTDYQEPTLTYDDKWVSLGDYALDENKVLSESDLLAISDDSIQLRFVIKSKEGETSYPVPADIRIAIDADVDTPGDQEMDTVDPYRKNIDPLPDTVNTNAPYVEVRTRGDVTKKVHVNHLTQVWGRYSDTGLTQISQQARAGYFVSPEVPAMTTNLIAEYLMRVELPKENPTDLPRYSYEWTSENILIRSSSTIMKYTGSIQNLTNEEILALSDSGGTAGQTIKEDILTNPELVLVLPFAEEVDEENYHTRYIDAYSSQYATSALSPDFTSSSALRENDTLWSYYVVDSEGNKIEHHGIKGYSFATESRLVSSSVIPRRVMDIEFEGFLNPGETIVVEYMVSLDYERLQVISTTLAQTYLYAYKLGSYRPLIKQNGPAGTSFGYALDTNDINENEESTSENMMTVSMNGVAFDARYEIIRDKRSFSEIELEGLGNTRPSLVPEGTKYHFDSTIFSQATAESKHYESVILYDVLPHNEDMSIVNTLENIEDDSAKPTARLSKWQGWLDLNSIQVTRYATDATNTLHEDVLENGKHVHIWVGPFVKQADGTIDYVEDGLPEYIDRKEEGFYATLYENDALKEAYFVRLSDLLSMQASDPEQFEAYSKLTLAIWAEVVKDSIDDVDVDLDGRVTFELSYELQAAINLPRLNTMINPEEEDLVVQDLTKDYTGWNTFVYHAASATTGEGTYIESPRAGVYLGNPQDRGYLGSYVWLDENYNYQLDEASYIQREDGRWILDEVTKDLNHDGVSDDPGINGVYIELLNEYGLPSNKEGEAVRVDNTTSEELYYKVDEKTGVDLRDEYNQLIPALYGPATMFSQSDYLGNEGYFIFSNLKPGQYQLRYTFLDDQYDEYHPTVQQIGKTNQDIEVYRNSKDIPNFTGIECSDCLIVQTSEAIQVDAIQTDTTTHFAYDELMTSYNLGISNAYVFGGRAWIDEQVVGSDILSDGLWEAIEAPLENVQITIYEVIDGERVIAKTPSGEDAIIKTDEDGKFEIQLIPYRNYVAVATLDDVGGAFKVTPFLPTRDVTSSNADNDLFVNEENAVITSTFYAEATYDDEGNVITTPNGMYGVNEYIGLGFVSEGRSFIGRYVWDDLNYNGIRDEYQNDLGEWVYEPGIGNVTLTLNQFYYDPDSETWEETGKEETTMTSATGEYLFQNIATQIIVDGNIYVAGYQVEIDFTTIDENYAITHFQISDSIGNSDLPRNTESGMLMPNESGMIILLEEEQSTSDPLDVFVADGKRYDVTQIEMKLDVDAGFKAYELGSIEGTFFFDYNANGQMDEEEAYEDFIAELMEENEELTDDQLPSFTLELSTFYLDAQMKWQPLLGVDSQPLVQSFKVNNENGATYLFDDLAVFTQVEAEGEMQNHLLGYQLAIIDDTGVMGLRDLIPAAYTPTINGLGNTMMSSPIVDKPVEPTPTDDPIATDEPLPTPSSEPIPLPKVDRYALRKTILDTGYANGELNGMIVLGSYQGPQTRSLVANVSDFDVVIGTHARSYHAALQKRPIIPTIPFLPHIPNTSDTTNTLLWLVIMGCSGLGCVVLYRRRRQRR